MALSSSALVDVDDMDAFGFDEVDPKLLDRVSAKVRRYTGQHITRTTSTAKGYSPLRLGQAPVVSVSSVVDEFGAVLDEAAWRLQGQVVTGPVARGINDFEINLPRRGRAGWIEVTYESGYDVVPDELKELVCGIAARVAGLGGGAGPRIRQQTVGGESVVYDTASIAVDLNDVEKAELRAFFGHTKRRGARTIDVGPLW